MLGIGALLFVSEPVYKNSKDAFNVAGASSPLCLLLKCYHDASFALEWSCQQNYIAKAGTTLIKEKAAGPQTAHDKNTNEATIPKFVQRSSVLESRFRA